MQGTGLSTSTDEKNRAPHPAGHPHERQDRQKIGRGIGEEGGGQMV